MGRRLSGKLTYANVMATIAVFLTLGGAAWAVSTLPKNSVGTKQIKKNAVNSKKVKDASLLSKDFKAGQIPAGKAGPKGPKGDQGDTGLTGQTGPVGPSDTYLSSTTGSVSLTGMINVTDVESLLLPAGSYVVTGEATLDNASQNGDGYSSCLLIDPADHTFGFGTLGLGPNSGFQDVDQMSLTGVVTLASQGTVRMACNYNQGSSSQISARQRQIFATKVGAITSQ